MNDVAPAAIRIAIRRVRRAAPALVRALAAATALASAAAGAAGAEPQATADVARTGGAEALAPVYRDWLDSVAGLITPAERDYFLGLAHDYQRDAFMEAFWQPRDPQPLTPRNELRERWQEATAGPGTASTADPRFLLYLLNGPPGAYTLPDGRPVARCFSRSYDLEIWFYGGSERTSRRFPVIFYRVSSAAPYRVYLPGDAIRPTRRSGRLPTTDVRQLCADELLRFAAGEAVRIGNYAGLVEELLTPPTPPDEWLANLALSGAQLPDGASLFAVEATVDFPARRQSRTAVRLLLRVPIEEAPGRAFGGRRFHLFEATGEVVRDGRLFESFGYRFEGPTPEGAAAIPLGFTRYLRPGRATLRLLLRDLYADRYAEVVREIEVPSPAGLPEDPGESLLARLVGGPAGTGDGPSLRLDAPPGGALSGPVRFTARARGKLDKVTFYLDDRPVLSRLKPPWTAELNLGPTAGPRRVRVAGFVDDREVASDQLWLNQGAARFLVRLVEPRAGGIYPGGLMARVSVQTPDGQAPERVEIELDGERVATFSHPPFEQVLELAGSAPAVVRAVAYLADGSAAEDAVLVNSAGLTEDVQVRLVEVPVLVLDAEGEPILDLAPAELHLWENDRPLAPQRVFRPGEFPLLAALLIDRSASMQPLLGEVTGAAAGFVRAALASPGNLLATLSFADRLTADAGFTDRTVALERALAGLVARGATRLWDSVAEAAASFADRPGQRALVLFTDGAEEGSASDLESAIEAARRHGVTVFVVGPAGSITDRQVRRGLERLAGESGGRAWFLDSLDGLSGVYAEILARLRARYLITYQSPADGGDRPRPVRVEVDRKGARVVVQSAVR